jgi:hypothetical protein
MTLFTPNSFLAACAGRIARPFGFFAWNMFSIERLMSQNGCDWKQNIALKGDILYYYDTYLFNAP